MRTTRAWQIVGRPRKYFRDALRDMIGWVVKRRRSHETRLVHSALRDEERPEETYGRRRNQGFFFMPGRYALSGACSTNSTFSDVMMPYFGFAAVPELAFVNVMA